ncbi:MAG: SRPBCC family protein [Chloroflexota bacterium]
MIRVDITIEVERPSDEVFDYISNFENNPLWQSGMQEATITSKGPLGVGTTYVQGAKFLGRRIESNFEVLAYEPGRMVKAKSTSGTFPIEFMRSVTPMDTGTMVSAVIKGDATGIFKIAQPLLAPMVKRQIEADYANLKRVLEEDHPGP